MARARAGLAETGIGQEERSALLGSGLQGENRVMEAEETMEDTDPTQQLMWSLGQFEKAVRGARSQNDTLWSDECMNQLIVGVELSLSHGWPGLVDAFTDAGRILQTYENADRVVDALPFLESSAEILNTVADEVMQGGQAKTLEDWQQHYDGAVKRALESGLKLVDDTEDDAGTASDVSSATLTPFPVQKVDADGKSLKTSGDGELPTLDELPPLENMMAVDTPIPDDVEDVPSTDAGELAEAVINAAQDDAEVAAPAPQSGEPSRTVVDIVDRICDELAELKDRSPADRMLALEMIEGGIGALRREARQSGFETSASLCELMGEACQLLPPADEVVDERFTETCFAFCGVFVEAMSDPTSENIAEWQAECTGLIADWTPVEEVPAAEEPEPAPLAEAAAEAKPIEEPEPAPAPPVETPVSEAPAIPTPVETTVVEAPVVETPVAAMPVVEIPVEAAGAPTAPPAQGIESQALFERAQQALLSGDTEAAKSLALQAAAAIAEEEAGRAETILAESETRLKLSLNSTAEARSGVTETEKLVKSAASHVAVGRRSLGEAKERTASMAQEVVESEEAVGEIDEQIAELQRQREQSVEQTQTAEERLNEARGNESSVSGRLDGLRAAEMESRKNLEISRQHVNDLQRNTAEIESAMEKAREELTRHKMSLEDIRQTMNQPQSQAPVAAQSEEELLF